MSPREIAFRAGVTKDWDIYRSVYNKLSIADLIDINTRWDEVLPVQNCASSRCILSLFKKLPVRNIAEFGCYRGGLASVVIEMLPDKINKWYGYDINHRAIEYSWEHNTTSNYKGVKLNGWFWDLDLKGFDTFVSTHTLEHLNLPQVQRLLQHVNRCRNIILELPPMQRQWRGYQGSHVLEGGLKVIERCLASYEKIHDVRYKMSWVLGYKRKTGE